MPAARHGRVRPEVDRVLRDARRELGRLRDLVQHMPPDSGLGRHERVRCGERAVWPGEPWRAGVGRDRSPGRARCAWSGSEAGRRRAARPWACRPRASRISRHSGPKSGRKKMLRSAQAWSSIFSCAASHIVSGVLVRRRALPTRTHAGQARPQAAKKDEDTAVARYRTCGILRAATLISSAPRPLTTALRGVLRQAGGSLASMPDGSATRAGTAPRSASSSTPTPCSTRSPTTCSTTAT